MTSYYPPRNGGGGGGSLFWGDAVANFAALPGSGLLGEVRQTIDTKKLYTWNGSAWEEYLSDDISTLQSDLFALTGVVATKENSFSVLPIAKGGTGSATGFSDLSVIVSNKENSFSVLPIAKGGTGSATGFSDLSTTVTGLSTNKLDKSGGTMTGALTLAGAPGSALQAATKGYVDGLVSGFTVVTHNSTGAPAILSLNDKTINLVNTSQSVGNYYLASLPTEAAGIVLHIKDISGNANSVYIQIVGSGTIDGASSYMLMTPYESVTLVCNGTNWFII